MNDTLLKIFIFVDDFCKNFEPYWNNLLIEQFPLHEDGSQGLELDVQGFCGCGGKGGAGGGGEAARGASPAWAAHTLGVRAARIRSAGSSSTRWRAALEE